jgi:hypothetical protein
VLSSQEHLLGSRVSLAPLLLSFLAAFFGVAFLAAMTFFFFW